MSRFWISLILFTIPAFAAEPDFTVSSDHLKKWCVELHSEVTRLKWPEQLATQACDGKIVWKQGGTSVEGRPLLYADFGDPQASNVTLIFAMVHGDEITPVYIGLQVANWVKQHESELRDRRVLIAPLVNPDGFYRAPKTRMNSRGVDVNRNFATRDWYSGIQKWKINFHADPRRNPGSEPRSEPETIFQEGLIRSFHPQKILSVHAPLNHMDYDGPTALSLKRFPREYVQECMKLQKELKAKSTGWFPGSLGNYAGREMGIPTVTLELPTANPAMADTYWRKFSQGIHTMIEFSIPGPTMARSRS